MCSSLQDFLEQTPSEAGLAYCEPYTHPAGRAVLIGDAAHPTLPFLAQGAAMAIEDAFILSRLMGESGTQPAISGLHAERIQRTSRIRLASRTNMGLFHRSHWFSQLATYGPIWLAGRLMPSVVQSRQDWIYRYDATGRRGSPV